jgi:hypothetical protein
MNEHPRMVFEIRQGEDGRRKPSRMERGWFEKPIRAQMVRMNHREQTGDSVRILSVGGWSEDTVQTGSEMVW